MVPNDAHATIDDNRSRNRLTTALLALLFALAAQPPPIVAAATFNVNSIADTVDVSPGNGVCQDGIGACTLRAAIMEANALSGTDTINLLSMNYELTIPGANEDSGATGDLDILGDLVLNGTPVTDGFPETAVYGGSLDRVFDVRAGSVALNYLWITDGFVVNVGGGLSGGGGVRNLATLGLSYCWVSFNDSDGRSGGIEAGGTVTISNSTIEGNNANNVGGGMGVGVSAQVTVIASTILNNDGSPGGGVYNEGNLTLINSTVGQNVASNGGGIMNGMFGTTQLRNATIYNNSASGNGGGVSSGVTTARNSIIAGNTAPAEADCFGALTSEGYNLIQDPSGCTISGDTTGNILGEDPFLMDLEQYGGPTNTNPPTPDDPGNPEEEEEPVPGSLAINAGNPAVPGSGGLACEGIDQRGALRLSLGSKRCDIGAVEIWTNLCGNGLVEDEDDPPDCDQGSAVATIGSLGGSLETSDGDVSLVVPPNALGQPTTVILVGNAVAQTSGILANLINARPAGQTFTSPVTFTFRWNDRDNDGKIDTGSCVLGANDGLSCDADADCDSLDCTVDVSNTQEADLVLKRDGDRFGSGGFASGPFRCGDHQSGACSTAAANCADAPGTGLASAANCCDTATNTWTFQTCSFSEFLAGRREADMIPGKGSFKTDCHGEWRPRNPFNSPYFAKGRAGELKHLNYLQVCTDGDPNCDWDQSANNKCVFEVAVSLDVNDVRLINRNDVQLCNPLTMKKWSLLKPKSRPNPKNNAIIAQNNLNATALLDAVKLLGLHSQVGDHQETLDFVTPIGGDCEATPNCDTGKAKVTVPLTGKNSNRKGTKVLKMSTITPQPLTGKPPKDTDVIKLVCMPRP